MECTTVGSGSGIVSSWMSKLFRVLFNNDFVFDRHFIAAIGASIEPKFNNAGQESLRRDKRVSGWVMFILPRLFRTGDFDCDLHFAAATGTNIAPLTWSLDSDRSLGNFSLFRLLSDGGFDSVRHFEAANDANNAPLYSSFESDALLVCLVFFFFILFVFSG